MKGLAMEETIAELRELAGAAQKFSLVQRSIVCRPDGAPESDTDHTVMLGWLATSLAHRYWPYRLNLERVALYSLYHDMPEYLCGDTQTFRIDENSLAEKRHRELVAIEQIDRAFTDLELPFRVLSRYEGQRGQRDLESKYVWAVDKWCPKFVHMASGYRDLIAFGTTYNELAAFLRDQELKFEKLGLFAALPGFYELSNRLYIETLEGFAMALASASGGDGEAQK